MRFSFFHWSHISEIGLGVLVGQHLFLFDHGHVSYQIEGDDTNVSRTRYKERILSTIKLQVERCPKLGHYIVPFLAA